MNRLDALRGSAIAEWSTASISVPSSLLSLQASDGATITTAKRDELLAKVKSGAHVEVIAEVLAYEQCAGYSNRNFVRFQESAIAALAKSGTGCPFLRDHAQSESLAVGGRIRASAQHKPGEGHFEIRQTVSLTAPWAVDLALRGLMGPVSIGWRATGPVNCSACKTPVFTICQHFPGDRVVEVNEGGRKVFLRKSDGPITIEWVYTAGELVETSAVVVPAVPGARIEEIRASLALATPGQDRHHSATSQPLEGAQLIENRYQPPHETASSSRSQTGIVMPSPTKSILDRAEELGLIEHRQSEFAICLERLAKTEPHQAEQVLSSSDPMDRVAVVLKARGTTVAAAKRVLIQLGISDPEQALIEQTLGKRHWPQMKEADAALRAQGTSVKALRSHLMKSWRMSRDEADEKIARYAETL